MNKQAALVKLAQVRLAINHVLRSRMVKQATNNPNIKIPGNVDYDPYKGYSETAEDTFIPYDANKAKALPPPSIQRIIPDLTPKTVTNPKVNPYLGPKFRQNNYFTTNPDAYRTERIHSSLFGIPTFQTGRDIDTQTINDNIDNIGYYYSIPKYYDDIYTRIPLENKISEHLGFPYNNETQSYDNMEATVREYKGDGGFDEYKGHIMPNGYDSDQNLNGVPFAGGIVQDEAGNNYMRRSFFPEERQPFLVELPYPDYGLDDYNKYVDYIQRMKAYNTETQRNIDDYKTQADLDMADPNYSQHRDKLMHAYIDRSLVGKAFANYPSISTGIPYAAYHALPYLWSGNRSEGVNRVINNAKGLFKKYYNAR